MIRRHPISTRIDTLFPDPTLFRSTAVSCCGANPGMVSWFVKQALLNIAADTNLDAGLDAGAPAGREDWARLMQRLGVKGIHIAERDTQRAREPRPMRSEEHTSELQSLMRISYAVFCLKKKKN